jgi:hypothetical protein
MKIVPMPEILFRDVYRNITDAIAEGKPTLLHRVSSKEARKNRRDALRGKGIAGFGLSWDEYPFASSLEGGDGAHLMPVPLSENWLQGGVLSACYYFESIKAGDEYLVVPLPEADVNQ